MPLLYKLLFGLVILIIGFFWFRFLMRTGKARKAFDMQERDQNTAELKIEAKWVASEIQNRKKDLRRQQEAISKELKQK